MDVVAIVSGGLDSVTLAYELAADPAMALRLVAFDYGQRHRKEVAFAEEAARALGAEHDLVAVPQLASLLPGSSLTDDKVAVPEGHYADETMKATVVPNRNAIMLSIATGI